MNAEIDDPSGLESGTGCVDSSFPSDDATPDCVEGTGTEFEDFSAVASLSCAHTFQTFDCFQLRLGSASEDPNSKAGLGVEPR